MLLALKGRALLQKGQTEEAFEVKYFSWLWSDLKSLWRYFLHIFSSNKIVIITGFFGAAKLAPELCEGSYSEGIDLSWIKWTQPGRGEVRVKAHPDMQIDAISHIHINIDTGYCCVHLSDLQLSWGFRQKLREWGDLLPVRPVVLEHRRGDWEGQIPCIFTEGKNNNSWYSTVFSICYSRLELYTCALRAVRLNTH